MVLIRFGIQQDLFYGPEFSKKILDPEFGRFFEIIADSKLNPRKVKAGRILGFFEDKITMEYQIKSREDLAGLGIHPFILQEEELYFGVSREVSIKTLNSLQAAYIKLSEYR